MGGAFSVGAAEGVEAAAAAAAAPAGRADGEPDPLVVVNPPDEEGTESDDDEDEDYIHAVIRSSARGFREAVRFLERADEPLFPIQSLNVGEARRTPRHGGGRAAAADADDDDDDALSFPRFVALLEPREGFRTLRDLHLRVEWSGLRPPDMVRLFRDVLPGHPTLRFIEVNTRRLPATFVKFLTESVPTQRGAWRLSGLQFSDSTGLGDAIDDDDDNASEIFQAILDMLKRNAAIQDLRITFRLDGDQCKLICQALSRNTNVSTLHLQVEEASADALVELAAVALQSLHLDVSCSDDDDDAVRAFARRLRTNETLQHLTVRITTAAGSDVRGDLEALVDLVKTYNYTLGALDSILRFGDHVVRLHFQVQEYMSRNRRIRDAFEALRRPNPDRRPVVPPQLLSRLLGLVSDVPTALYRILKMGYVNEVGDRLAAAQVDGNVRRRGRRRRRRRH